MHWDASCTHLSNRRSALEGATPADHRRGIIYGTRPCIYTSLVVTFVTFIATVTSTIAATTTLSAVATVATVATVSAAVRGGRWVRVRRRNRRVQH